MSFENNVIVTVELDDVLVVVAVWRRRARPSLVEVRARADGQPHVGRGGAGQRGSDRVTDVIGGPVVGTLCGRRGDDSCGVCRLGSGRPGGEPQAEEREEVTLPSAQRHTRVALYCSVILSRNLREYLLGSTLCVRLVMRNRPKARSGER